jgi:hypothetical protein
MSAGPQEEEEEEEEVGQSLSHERMTTVVATW